MAKSFFFPPGQLLELEILVELTHWKMVWIFSGYEVGHAESHGL